MENQVVLSVSNFNTSELRLKGFKVYQIEAFITPVPTFNRRDFYKVCLVTSKSIIHYADRGIEIDGTFLFFGNPLVPYSKEVLSEEQSGYACLFTEEFLHTNDRSESFKESPLFKIGGTPVIAVNNEQKEFISTIFQKMLSEQNTDYTFKKDLIRNYINLIIHEALKMQPSDNFFKPRNATSRIASLFLELLEMQFPIESPKCPLQLKTAQQFANSLAIHINYLNRSVKEVTGKPTTMHIAERIISEAKALLQHTDWGIAEIAYALGFEYPSYFNNYFKRMTGTTPKSFRP